MVSRDLLSDEKNRELETRGKKLEEILDLGWDAKRELDQLTEWLVLEMEEQEVDPDPEKRAEHIQYRLGITRGTARGLYADYVEIRERVED